MSHYYSRKRCGMICAVGLVSLIAVALIQQRVLRILYHGGAMAWEWKISRRKMLHHASASVPMPPYPSLPQSLKRHEALVRLGEFILIAFGLAPFPLILDGVRSFKTSCLRTRQVLL